MYVQLSVLFFKKTARLVKSVTCRTLLSRFYVIWSLGLGLYVGALLLAYYHFICVVLHCLSCVFPVMWAVILACLGVHRLPAFGCLTPHFHPFHAGPHAEVLKSEFRQRSNRLIKLIQILDYFQPRWHRLAQSNGHNRVRSYTFNGMGSDSSHT